MGLVLDCKDEIKNKSKKSTMKILHTSWGYNMTHNDFCKVISETEKSVMCQMIGSKVVSGDACYNGREVAVPEKVYGEPFRLLKRPWDNKVTNKVDMFYRGSYPYMKDRTEKRKDSFTEVSPEREFYFNYMD